MKRIAFVASAVLQATAVATAAPPPEVTELDLFRVEETVRLQVPTVVTVSREEEKATEAPATTVVVTREEIRLRGYSFLKDALRDVPGMETLEYHFSEYGTLVPVRGVIGNNKIIVLVNGMRVNPPGGENMMLRSDISIRDADQIEIVYGPGSTLYGQDAISAVINIITRRTREENIQVGKADARDRLLGPIAADRRLATVGMEFGYPLQKEVWGSLNLRFGQARIYGSVHYLDKELTDLSRAYPAFWGEHEALGQGRGLPLNARRSDSGLNVLFRLEYENASIQVWHRQGTRSSSEGYGGLPPILGYVDEARWEDMSTVAEARYTLPIGRYFSLESALTFNRYEIQPSSRYVFQVPANQPGQPPVWFLDDFKYGRGISGALEERLIFRLSSRLNIVAGIFVAHYDVTPKSTVPGGADRSGSIPEQGGSFVYFSRQGDADSRVELPRVNPLTYQDFGGYLEGNWRILKLLRLIVGLRLDKNTSVSQLAFSPRAALIFNYEQFSAKYIFSRAFVAPPPYFKYNVYYRGDTLNVANPDLAPETAMSNELNFSYNGRYASIGTSFYYNTQDNLLLAGDYGLAVNFLQRAWLDAPGTQAINLTRSANAGSSKALGADFFGKWSAWKFSGWASYSFTNFSSEVEGKVNPMTGISAHNFRLGVTCSILKNLHATLGTVVRSIPENLPRPDQLAGLIGVPWELNAHIVYAPIPSVDLYADFRNLTDNKYYLASLSTIPYPVQAFQGSGGLRLQF